jgi:hypothetical protein
MSSKFDNALKIFRDKITETGYVEKMICRDILLHEITVFMKTGAFEDEYRYPIYQAEMELLRTLSRIQDEQASVHVINLKEIEQEIK